MRLKLFKIILGLSLKNDLDSMKENGSGDDSLSINTDDIKNKINTNKSRFKRWTLKKKRLYDRSLKENKSYESLLEVGYC